MTTQHFYSNDQAALAEIFNRDVSHVGTLIDLAKTMRSALTQVQASEQQHHASRVVKELLEKLADLQTHLATQESENREQARS